MSGRAPVDPAATRLVSDDVRGAGADRPRDIGAVLESGRLRLGSRLRVECFLADAARFPHGTGSGASGSRPPRPARTTVVAGFAVPGMLIELQVTAGVADIELSERHGGRGRRRRRRPLLRLLPAQAGRGRHGRRVQPRRQRRLVRQRRLALPGAGRAAAGAGADLLRHARAVRPRLGALLQARRAGSGSRRGCCASGRTATSATTTTGRRRSRGSAATSSTSSRRCAPTASSSSSTSRAC